MTTPIGIGAICAICGNKIGVGEGYLTGWGDGTQSVHELCNLKRLGLAKSTFGSEIISSAASLLGRKGGQAKSERKTLAVRENGKKGGRPTMKTKTWVVLNNENGAFFGTVKAKTWKKALTEAYDAFSPDRRFTLDVISEAEYREKEGL